MGKDWLKAKTFGMPRWAFLSLLVGGVAVGLYIRARRNAANQPADTTLQGTDTLAGSSDAGLAGVGVTSPPGGVYPVTTPVIPEGLTQVISDLTGLASEQGSALVSVAQPFTPSTPPTVNVTLPGSGGGPPNTPAKRVNVTPNKNLQKGSPRYGQTFTVQPGKGGVWHVYPGGKRVFVKK